MAGKIKPGISFYRMDCDHFNDPKIRLLLNYKGIEGYYVWIRLITHGYGNLGYYFDTNDHESFELFAVDCGKDLDYVKAVIVECINRKLFNKEIYETHGLLTSEKMQENFLIATESRRKKNPVNSINILPHLSLIRDIPGKEEIIPKKEESIPKNDSQIREDKKKGNEKKVNKTMPPPAAAHDDCFLENLIKEHFTADFLPIWERWKNYKLKEFKFKYKSHDSELEAFKELVNYSGGNEVTAVEIIKKSMANGWKGLFELKDPIKKATIAAPVKSETQSSFKINYLYGRYCENPNQVTIISVDSKDYDIVKQANLINFTEDIIKQIRNDATDHLNLNNKEVNDENTNSFMKRFGLIEFFKHTYREGKETIF
jgi:hypothetical protein